MSEETQNKKTEVVGWTDNDNEYFPDCKNITEEVIDAIVADIRANGYLFGGDMHQSDSKPCTPVLSDGTKACFSWRGWGAVMAKAYSVKGKLSYMYAYMDELIKPEARSYPEERIDFDRITVKGKCYKFNTPSGRRQGLDSLYFLLAGSDTTEKINVGSYLCIDEPDEYIFSEYKKVVKVWRGASFEQIINEICGEPKSADGELFEVEPGGDVIEDYRQRVLRDLQQRNMHDNFYPSEFGYPAEFTRGQLFEALYSEFPQETVKEYGAVCFKLHWLMEGDVPNG